MTDNEIIKALECCIINEDCTGCPLQEENTQYCLKATCKNALDLINRQQATIRKLQLENEKLEIELKSTTEAWKTSTNSAMKVIKKQDAEIERLENMVAQNEGVLPEYENLIKAEAIKEFAERLKPKLSVYDEVYVDNLVKEMVGEE